MFLLMLNYKKPIEIVDQYVTAHRDYLAECYKKDYLVVSGPKNPRTGGIMISQLSDRAKLEEMISQDPFKIHDIAEFEIIEFSPVRYHQDFASFIVK
jgi:uncharacterized protein YciI